jgi:hypothetical protein
MELIDLGNYQETYADGLAAVQVLGCCARLLYFTYQPTVAGIFRRVVVASIVRPVSTMGQSAEMIRAAIAAPSPAVLPRPMQ